MWDFFKSTFKAILGFLTGWFWAQFEKARGELRDMEKRREELTRSQEGQFRREKDYVEELQKINTGELSPGDVSRLLSESPGTPLEDPPAADSHFRKG